jgi:carboxyl-terminal processing protease
MVLGAVSFATVQSALAGKRATLERSGFDAAVDAMLDRHVEPVDAEVLARGLKHMAAGLDGHSRFLTALERARLRAREGTTGLGVAYARSESGAGRVEIVAVLPGSSAERAGLAAGDRILRIAGRETRFMHDATEVELALTGPVGELVAVEAVPMGVGESRVFELPIERSRAELVEGRLVVSDGREFAVVRIAAFRAGIGRQTAEAIEELEQRAGGNLAGIVLDLRSNPGGEITEAVVVADRFLERGVIVRTRGRGGRILREESAHAAGTDTHSRVAVLVDRHSASAAELLAAALQDHKRATIVGERTFGKGTVQEVFGLPDGSVLEFTVARYFTPDDRTIHGVGVVPDLHVSSSGALDAALAALR